MMSQNVDVTERRCWERFALKERAYTANTSKPGMVIDVSLAGMGVRYFDRKQQVGNSAKLDLIVDDMDFFLGEIPVTIVSDEDVKDKMHDPAMAMKRLGLRFGTLTRQQQSSLEYFIRSFASVEGRVVFEAICR